jgi:glyoxylase-like metal-dependent hydrolase (beta-lactamase superfamily II)
MTEITPGIHWLKIPIDMEDSTLSHVNSYIIRGKDGYVIVDTGWDTETSFNTLKEGMAEIGSDIKEISRVLITHIHPDHFGMAGRIKQISGAEIAMHEIEKEVIGYRYIPIEDMVRQTSEALAANGTPLDDIIRLGEATAGLEHFANPMYPDILFHNDEIVNLGAFNFRVIRSPGHSAGHMCLYEPDRKILLSGDHILPTITPHISIHPTLPSNPLKEYLTSLKEMRKLDVELVLPGHDEPFDWFVARIDQIIHHHEERNREILAAVRNEPKTAYEIAQDVTWGNISSWKVLPAFHQRLAIFETLSHLEMMTAEGKIARKQENGIIYYRKT